MSTPAAETFVARIPDEHHGMRETIEEVFHSVSGYIKASLRPLPTDTGNGTYLPEKKDMHLMKDLAKLGFHDYVTLSELIESGVTKEKIKDSEYLMERLIQIANKLPMDGKSNKALSNGLVDLLWSDLQHPPLSYMGEDYKYRQADGSNNNLRWPQLGQAGMSYARTVKSSSHLPAFSKPDPGVLFDSLLARDGFQPHPNKLSSVLFYLASIIIHDIFKTSHRDPGISLTSSYLDLAPLYGSNQEEQDQMRTFQDGMLKVDCFSEKRILGFPPGVSVLLIMFNRFHNYIAAQLALINENNRFDRPAKLASEAAWKKYDNDLFQTSRLVTCGLYVNIILKDYVRVILNLHRTDSSWNLDPRSTQGKKIFGGSAEGVGNQVSAEFNLVYRWHAAISERDAAWTEQLYGNLFPDKDPDDVTVEDLRQGLGAWEQTIPADPQQRTFEDIPRDADGRLDDDMLANILTASIDDVAGSFGAQRVPKVLRAVEILGIQQARRWNLATLNEFREFFNLAPHKTFQDINPDPNIATQLKNLYGEPDLVELYPGLVVEAAKEPMSPGSGLCPSFTTSRAVLSDAVALVRGDRFYTIDYTPGNLTSFGFKAASYDNAVDQGHVFYKLILRAFPQHYKPNSVYAHFPLVNPEETRQILKSIDKEDKYDFSEPKYTPKPHFINSYKTGTKILKDKHTFGITWGPVVTNLMKNSGFAYGSDFMLSGDGRHNQRSRELMQSAMYRNGWQIEVRKMYEQITINLLKGKSYRLAGENEVDMVRDVGNYAQVHFAAEVFNLPLKTKEHPHRPYTEKELYLTMALVFICIFFDKDPVKSMALQATGRKLTQVLGKLMEKRLAPLDDGSVNGAFRQVIELFHQRDPLPEYGTHLVEKLHESGLQLKDIVWSQVLGTAGGMVSIQGQLFAQVLDFYLRPENELHLRTIQRLAHMNSGDADDQILHYFMEGARITSSIAIPRHVNKDVTVEEKGEKIQLKEGDNVVVNLVACSHDEEQFPNPETVDLTRPISSYIHYGWGPHQCLGTEMSKVALSTMLKTVAKLDNLRRAPGPSGCLNGMKMPGGFTVYMQEDGSDFFPFPTTMKVRWDGEIPEPKHHT